MSTEPCMLRVRAWLCVLVWLAAGMGCGEAAEPSPPTSWASGTGYEGIPALDSEAPVLHTLGEGVLGAVVGETPFGRLIELRYTLPGSPFDTVADDGQGPGSWRNLYGQHRKTFPVLSGEDVGVVWQDQRSGQPWVTWISQTDPGTHRTVALPLVSTLPELPESQCTETCEWSGDGECDDGGPGSAYSGCDYGTDCVDCGVRTGAVLVEVLVAAASDDAGNLYALHIQSGSGVPDDVRAAWLIKCDAEGQEVTRRQVDATEEGLDVVEFGGHQDADNHATLKWSAGRLGLMLARTMTQSADGLNHQGGIAVVFDAETLERVAHHGQTSGHSFSNFLTVDEAGRFVGIDLGDNYPRGVHLHRFDEGGIDSRVVYTFKTAHGTSAENPAGDTFALYEEISDEEMSFFQWSNDNATYTEIGGVVETPAGLAVL
ncbi:MAG: hypothetical protein QF464_03855, partial [Myxococcota bacterium]|nr:hypothetical protein [Myxococcota bacterium]